MRYLLFLTVTIAASACGSVCEQAAQYRSDCGAPPVFSPERQCGPRTEAACEAECDLEADCIVFVPPTNPGSQSLLAAIAANEAWEDCLETCTVEDVE